MIEDRNFILTKEGKKAIEEELHKLVSIERPKVIDEIKKAREQGDLSENSEFDAARERQGQIEDRINEIERILNKSQLISTETKTGENIVHIGSTVTLTFNNSKIKQQFIIVGSIEADPLKGKISNDSPVALAILGKKVGDTILVDKSIKTPKS